MSGRRNGKLGIALAGGGPLGAIYEIGALVALEKALKGLTLTDLDVYVGVSSGAFLAAGLANGMAPSEMHAMFILDRSHHDPFEPEILLRPAFGEYAQRLMRMPELIQAATLAYFGALPTGGLVDWFMRLTRGLPNGLFDNGAFAAYYARRFSEPGRTNDFRKLPHKLFIVATDLDSGKSVPFGAPGLDHVPISEAIKASAALPGLYPPARIGDRDYVDGALKKALHASVALREGAKLVICVNPLVPYDADRAASAGAKPVRLADRGLLTVLSQTFRALIHSRMRVGVGRYAKEFPDADVVLFEPAQDDEVIFFANMFSYADRRTLADHAYRHTLAELKRRTGELGPILARHGVEIDRSALQDEGGTPSKPSQTGKLWDSVKPLEKRLGELEKALSRDKPGRSEGVERDAAKAAPPDT
ncbi:MAG TPA: patatin-like phospholipase family protein [Roseiarcus sp.]|nr:patatin-like phospholipase family protein [Roseiarcus sp.]